ncbi:MAG: DUF4893 domain-containing protein [Hyphomicrobiales bacterium]|nr:DUF4893 domain-containing protein [Hyphomicrobiales bacterium]
MTSRILALVALALLLAATPSRATGEIEGLITQADRDRLAKYEATREEALKEARAGGSAEDIATLEKAISPAPQSWSSFDMTGDWQCRTIKAGGLAQLVVYGWFKCRVTDDGSGWTLTKLTGSQKTRGRFFTDSDTRLTYLGAFAVNDDPFPAYGKGAETDQAGYAFLMSPKSWRIEFPAPYYESKLDILEFRR